jgi:hypothetical protein
MGEAHQPAAENPVNPVAPGVPQPIGFPKLLIGEGKEEFYFFRALARSLGLTDVKVEQYAGKDNLGNYLEALPLRPDYREITSIGITRDADENADRAFQSVCGFLKNNGLPVPAAPGDAAGGPPLVRVFILPGGGRAGMLEDLCMDAAASDPTITCVDGFIQCLHAMDRNPEPLAKARTHAWLASLERPDLELGQAAEKGWVPFEHPAFEELRAFFRNL